MQHETLTLTNIGSSAQELARSVLTDSLRSVRCWLKQAAREWTADEEIVHQLRVSGRRALSAIMLVEALLLESEVRWFRKQLKAILQAAGRARDLDVLIRTQLPRCGKAHKFQVPEQQPLVFPKTIFLIQLSIECHNWLLGCGTFGVPLFRQKLLSFTTPR